MNSNRIVLKYFERDASNCFDTFESLMNFVGHTIDKFEDEDKIHLVIQMNIVDDEKKQKVHDNPNENKVQLSLVFVDENSNNLLLFLSTFLQQSEQIWDIVFEYERVLRTKDNVSAHFEDKELRYRIKDSKEEKQRQKRFFSSRFQRFTSTF